MVPLYTYYVWYHPGLLFAEAVKLRNPVNICDEASGFDRADLVRGVCLRGTEYGLWRKLYT